MANEIYKNEKRKIAPSHPGSILKSGFIEQYHLRIEDVADLLGLTRGHLSRIINARAPVTPDLSIRLHILTQVPVQQWLALQSKYDLWILEKEKDFSTYKEALDKWASLFLKMVPKGRLQKNEESTMLISEASILAKQIGRKQKTVH